MFFPNDGIAGVKYAGNYKIWTNMNFRDLCVYTTETLEAGYPLRVFTEEDMESRFKEVDETRDARKMVMTLGAAEVRRLQTHVYKVLSRNHDNYLAVRRWKNKQTNIFFNYVICRCLYKGNDKWRKRNYGMLFQAFQDLRYNEFLLTTETDVFRIFMFDKSWGFLYFCECGNCNEETASGIGFKRCSTCFEF